MKISKKLFFQAPFLLIEAFQILSFLSLPPLIISPTRILVSFPSICMYSMFQNFTFADIVILFDWTQSGQ